MAYLTLAQFCQRIVNAGADEETLSTFECEQLDAVRKGLKPERFFDVPSMLKACKFSQRGGSDYAAVGDMLAKVLRSMRPVATDVEGFSVLCDEVRMAP